MNMKEKFREQALVLANENIASGIFDLRLKAATIVKHAAPGQFVSVYSNDRSRLLPRPISICGADPETGELRLVFRVAGRGTEEFSKLKPGETVDLTGPLGNGFPLERAFPEDSLKEAGGKETDGMGAGGKEAGRKEAGGTETDGMESGAGKTVFLIGGGIGIPPMVQLAKSLQEKSNEIAGREDAGHMTRAGAAGQNAAPHIYCILGFRDELFLTDDLKPYGDLVIATEDGSHGTKGNVLDAIRENGLKADVIYACGPTPMLRALKKYAEETGTECWLSLEEKMACGIGACLSCVCRSTAVDGHSNVKNKRVCTEGPVFLSTDVDI